MVYDYEKPYNHETLGPGNKKEIDFEKLFAPKDQGGGGLDLLSLTDSGQKSTRMLNMYNGPIRDLYGWDVQSNVWNDPSLLKLKEEIDLMKLIKKLKQLDSEGKYEESDRLEEKYLK